MRVTQNLNQFQFVAAITALEANLSQTQNQLATNLSFTAPSQDPVAAGAVNDYTQALSQSQQHDTNANSAQASLGTEDNALSHVQSALQSLRSLALQANSGVLSNQDRAAIATQATQIQATLVSLANTRDGNGDYIFAGFASQTQPFAATSSGVTYSGDQGQRQVQIAAGQSVAVGDNGDAVFNQIKTGNGIVTAAAGAANTGAGVLGATTVSNPAAYDGGTYSINFIAGNSYEVRDAANALVASGSYADGQAIAFRGVEVTLNGQPASGDRVSVAPSSHQSVFATVQNLVNALQSGTSGSASKARLGNAIASGLDNIDQTLDQLSNVRAAVGGRLNSITTQLSVSGSQQIQLQNSISSLQGLDYASALTKLDQQKVTLSAALQAYTITQGLTLFKFL